MRFDNLTQPANFDPTTGAPLAPVASATIVPDNKVQVQVPAYGGGGVTGVMYNGDMVSVEIPKDALGGTTIWVDVPEAYRKWTGGWGEGGGGRGALSVQASTNA